MKYIEECKNLLDDYGIKSLDAFKKKEAKEIGCTIYWIDQKNDKHSATIRAIPK